MKCKHKWVDMEDGTNDVFCVKCRKFFMQASLPYPIENKANMGLKNTIAINLEPPSVEEMANQLNEQLSRSTMMAMHRAGRRL